MPSELKGKVVYRLRLHQVSSEISSSRKRTRLNQEDERTQKLPEETQPTVEPWESSGLFFIPSKASSYKEYLLSLPQDLLRQACSAALFGQDVVLSHYSVIPLSASDVALLEVHGNGLQTKQMPSIYSQQESNEEESLTLAEFRRKERAEAEEMNTVQKKKRYNIIATIDAISPIIAMDPSDPFALIELYDKDTEGNSCVVVLNGAQALTCHSALFPGESVLFRGLIRKPWPVPNIFQGKPAYRFLSKRIPSWVFVSKVPCCVSWSRALVSRPSPLPPTPVPLVSFEGKIVRVETTSIRKGKDTLKAIHWLDLISCGEEEMVSYRLFLTHFPMPTTLQLSLRFDATIRAVNVHQLCNPLQPLDTTETVLFCGACLRSTISILRTAAEEGQSIRKHGQESSNYESCELQANPIHFGQSSTVGTTISLTEIVPYGFLNITRSYSDSIYYDHLGNWLDDNFLGTSVCGMIDLPSADDLICVLNRKMASEEQLEPPTLPPDTKLTPRRKKPTRNPYAEFFDHASGDLVSDGHFMEACGCRLSREERQIKFRPIFFGLLEIRTTGLKLLAAKLSNFISAQPRSGLSSGWTGSIHLQQNEFLAEMKTSSRAERDDAIASSAFTGGHVVEANNDQSPLSLSDKNCRLPVAFSTRKATNPGTFIVCSIERVVISCLCILVPNPSDQANDIKTPAQEASLPPIATASFNQGRGLLGGCALLRVHNHIFVASVHLLSKGPIESILRGSGDKCESLDLGKQKGVLSIKHCLESPLSLPSCTDLELEGLLIRTRFKHARVQSNGFSNCCVLTISHKSELSGVPCMQEIDLKIGVPCDKSQLDSFKRALTSMLSTGMAFSEDQHVLGACWWSMADSGRFSALTSGGWDECLVGNAMNTCVQVSFPSRAVSIGDRGYLRFACKLEDIEATHYDYSSGSDSVCLENESDFIYIGYAKFIDGMLSRRPTRLSSSQSLRVVGERIAAPLGGVPNCKLSEIFSLVCHVLCDKNAAILSPSLVRRLSGAHFLGVAFCQVQCICGRCFNPLVYRSPVNSGLGRRKNEAQADEVSFWHLPRPVRPVTSSKSSSTKDCKVGEVTEHARKSNLRCPNACPVESFEVKWECSGVLDDGTGQAKLYSERDVALTLLGMTSKFVEYIEQGVWFAEGGTIRYNKSIPPSQKLQNQVQEALNLAQNRKQDPLLFLPPAARAEYLLQHHCRSSKAPRRKLDYFVRCKPLADNISHLNHTMVETFIPEIGQNHIPNGEAPTYSLPPLKLQLVDCSTPSFS